MKGRMEERYTDGSEAEFWRVKRSSPEREREVRDLGTRNNVYKGRAYLRAGHMQSCGVCRMAGGDRLVMASKQEENGGEAQILSPTYASEVTLCRWVAYVVTKEAK